MYWCEDDHLNTFLENLRNGKDARKLAAEATSNPLAPKWQDGHGWCYVHPNDSPTIGPIIGSHFKQVGFEDLTAIRSEIKYQAENFLMDCGINQATMRQLEPEHYRQTAAKTINVDPEVGELQDHMHAAYKKLEEIDKRSITYVQDQGSAEIGITILAQHIKSELDNIGRTTDKAEE